MFPFSCWYPGWDRLPGTVSNLGIPGARLAALSGAVEQHGAMGGSSEHTRKQTRRINVKGDCVPCNLDRAGLKMIKIDWLSMLVTLFEVLRSMPPVGHGLAARIRRGECRHPCCQIDDEEPFGPVTLCALPVRKASVTPCLTPLALLNAVKVC
jgi:hypothetical protein